MSTDIKNRSEIIFLYDVTYANPNGDPMDGNRPRLDEDTHHCLVTDVRLKRTVRDYIYSVLKKEIFIREIKNDDGSVKDMKARLKDFLADPEKTFESVKSAEYEGLKSVLDKCIDIRLFGGVIPIEVKAKKGSKKKESGNEEQKSGIDKGSITLTGPVQFGIGKSLHPVEELMLNLSLVMATKTGSKTGSLAEGGKQGIKYGMIGFHGTINENSAAHTLLTLDDVEILMQSLWLGTKELKTTSKNQHPRLLIKIDYEPGFFIGDLLSPDRVKLDPISKDPKPEQFQDISDFIVNVSGLNAALKAHEARIKQVLVKQDERLNLNEAVFKSEPLNID